MGIPFWMATGLHPHFGPAGFVTFTDKPYHVNARSKKVFLRVCFWFVLTLQNLKHYKTCFAMGYYHNINNNNKMQVGSRIGSKVHLHTYCNKKSFVWCVFFQTFAHNQQWHDENVFV
jgi:hypothetical protein